MDRLAVKGFVEQTSGERPKKYRARTLEKIVSNVISKHERFMKKLNNDFEFLQNILQAIGPVYEKFGWFRLFSPIPFQREAWIRMNFLRASVRREVLNRAPRELASREI